MDEQIVGVEAISAARRRLPYLEAVEVMLCEDGIRYTFCPPRNAHGCILESSGGVIHISYTSTMKANGAKRAQYGFLWPIENLVYANERRQIIADILNGLDKGSYILRDNEKADAYDPTPHSEDFGRALDRARAADKKPKPPTNAKLQIKQLNGAWWLFHRQWMPLVFETFEEAAKFAKKYIAKPKTLAGGTQ